MKYEHTDEQGRGDASMSRVNLYPHQERLLEMTEDFDNVGYFVGMGLGKTYLATEKMKAIGNELNVIICQKSKITDWCDHIEGNYPEYAWFDLTRKKSMDEFLRWEPGQGQVVGVINYELFFRRKALMDFISNRCTLVLDESSLIQNEQAKRTKAVLKVAPLNCILLSGTVVNGNYEKLWSQCQLLGWPISKSLFDRHYVTYEKREVDGFIRKIPTGYRNVDRLKAKLRSYGGVFLKPEEVYDEMPQTTFNIIKVPVSKEYRQFKKDGIIPVEERVLIGDMLLTKRMYERMLCGQYSKAKLEAAEDIIESTDDRLIVFYWFTEEYNRLRSICEKHHRHVSTINGEVKDLDAYENLSDSVTLVQYQAGAMGHNLQKANQMILFSLPDGGMELYEQCLKRIDRIGQTRPCFYYILMCEGSIEEEIWHRLNVKKERTDVLFDNGEV